MLANEQFEAIESAETPETFVPHAERLTALYNGKYTIVSPTGSHRTFQIKTVKQGPLAGKRIIGLLTGPDNTSEYTGFGFVTDNGIRVWQRFRFSSGTYEKMALLVWNMGRLGENCGFGKQGFKIHLSKRCSICNRELTDPESIKFGVGPVCRAGGRDH